MSYNINWSAIIGAYDENPQGFIEKFLQEHPINWSLFDTSFINEGECFAPEFAKQQGWNYAGVECEEWERIYRIIEHIVAADTATPEVALLKIANEENWEWHDAREWENTVVAILNNPQATEEVLRTICLGFSYDFQCAEDCEVFKHVFEHPCITDGILDTITEEAYGKFGAEPEAIMEYAPNALLERFFEKISAEFYGAYSYGLDVLVQSPNISQDLFERAVEYVLAVDKEDMLRGRDFYSFEAMQDTIDNLLENPRTSKEFKDRLEELRNRLREWEEEEET